jgi:hypothetical protein
MIRAQEALLNLCSALGIDMRHIPDDVQEIIAFRIAIEDVLPTKPNIERVIEEVQRAEGGGQATGVVAPQEPAPPSAHRAEGGTSGDDAHPRLPAGPPSAHHGYRFNATEATEAKYRARLRLVHRTEDARSGLDIRPRRPDPLPFTVAHPACIAADAEGARPCSRCAPILHDIDCTCPACDYALGVMDE